VCGDNEGEDEGSEEGQEWKEWGNGGSPDCLSAGPNASQFDGGAVTRCEEVSEEDEAGAIVEVDSFGLAVASAFPLGRTHDCFN
jgi:hypothetical protein